MPSLFGYSVIAGERGAKLLAEERENLLGAVLKLRDDEREAAAGAIADLLLALDINEEAQRLVTNARAAIKSLATRLVNQEPIASPRSIQSTHAEVN